jgi:uncharacterized membrane protein
MRDQGKLLGGVLIGLGLAYLFDPDRGARRRALVRDKATSTGRRLADNLEATTRDLRNRAAGTAAELRGRIRREEVDDDVLHERVRSTIGRAVSHPGAIRVDVVENRVTLRGQVLEHELDDLLAAAGRVRGVSEVVNELEVHTAPSEVPSLQGEGSRPRGRGQSWSPATRLAVGAIGSGLLARALTGISGGRLTGTGTRRWGIDIHKVINVAAPIDQVWALWSNYENFPRFMSHLQEVRSTGEGRSHWTAVGPAGTRVSWEAVTTAWVPNELIAWRSVEGSTIEQEGRVRFRSTPEGGTQIDVRLAYNPPGGALGHAVAAMFGTDPKQAIDADLMRLKSLLEEGKTSAGKERVELDELATQR